MDALVKNRSFFQVKNPTLGCVWIDVKMAAFTLNSVADGQQHYYANYCLHFAVLCSTLQDFFFLTSSSAAEWRHAGHQKKLVRVKWSSWQDIHSCVLLLFLDRCCLPESHLCITKYQSIDMLKCCISTAISATLFSYFRNEWMNGLKACSNANFNGCQMNCEGLIN